MHKLFIAIAGFASLMAGGCAPGGGGANKTPELRLSNAVSVHGAFVVEDSTGDTFAYQGIEYVRLRGRDIVSILSGATLSQTPGSPLSYLYFEENFYRNSWYSMTVREPPYIYGKWEVTNDEVCVQRFGEEKRWCRRVFVSTDARCAMLIDESKEVSHYAMARSSSRGSNK